MARYLIEVPHSPDRLTRLLRIVPPAFRAQPRIVPLDKFSLQQAEQALAQRDP